MPRSTTIAESGQSLTEYGLIITVVAIACLGALALFGQGISGGLMELLGNSSSGTVSAVTANPSGTGSEQVPGSGGPAPSVGIGASAPAGLRHQSETVPRPQPHRRLLQPVPRP